MYTSFIKPFLDILVATIAFILLFPIFLLCVILLMIANKGRIFFVQPRPGKDERIFKVIKFKTMNDKVDKDGNLLSDEERLTLIGTIIRKTSLDELPQLINVMKGDMSFVGPRPLLMEYLELYDEEQKIRHKVTPGITGWAQVNGRNAISWEKKFSYDIWYVQHQSFWLDIKILFLTLIKVFKAEGISAEGMATMKKFKGNDNGTADSLHKK